MSRRSRRRHKSHAPSGPAATAHLGMDPQQARSFLAGDTPGVMARYAPTAQPSDEGWVESDDTVNALMEWRRYSIH